jgi:hypothetical protein
MCTNSENDKLNALIKVEDAKADVVEVEFGPYMN